MKTSALLLMAAATFCLGFSLQAAPVNYEDNFVFNIFQKRDGKWNVANNWSAKHVPVVPEDVVIRDNAGARIDSEVPAIRSILLGGKGTSVLTLSQGGVLNIENQLRIGRTEAKTGGVFYLDGGQLKTGLADLGHRLMVGDSSTHSSTGQAFLRSGTFVGGITVGSVLANTGVGTLSIVGGNVAVSGAKPKETLVLTPYGTLEFVLDAQGISTLDYKKTWLGLHKGSRIRIVGNDYKGPSKTFVLIAAQKMRDEGAVIDIEGFAPNYKVKADFDRRGLVLSIQSK